LTRNNRRSAHDTAILASKKLPQTKDFEKLTHKIPGKIWNNTCVFLGHQQNHYKLSACPMQQTSDTHERKKYRKSMNMLVIE